jgi:hypothetical protein
MKTRFKFWNGGGGRTRTYEGVSQRIYSPPPLPLGTLPRTEAGAQYKRRPGLRAAIWLALAAKSIENGPNCQGFSFYRAQIALTFAGR